ncbi:hypothetical protein [Streptomyces sp. NPDC127098]|uniref:hypothetical protein n=1 Tax=Streptomyces sp. NPDC127098 TaxID=3347137 RepID=UPI003663DEE5
MDDDVTSCRICGKFVLQVPGWTTYVQSYWLLRADWSAESGFFHGALHFSCLPGWEHEEAFRRELVEILIGRGRPITVEAEDGEHVLEQPGLYYSELVHQDGEWSIHRNTSTDRWLVLSRRGPWYFLDARQLGALAQGLPARADEGGERVRLPEGLDADAESATLAELLEALAIPDRYPGLLEHGSPDYRVWGYFPKKRGLEYSVAVDLPLPRSAAEFLAGYAREYEPIRFDEPG